MKRLAVMLAGDAMINETSGQDHSNTNVQVEGIDEGDLVKTDGEYIYAISGNSLLIFKAQDARRIGFAALTCLRSAATRWFQAR